MKKLMIALAAVVAATASQAASVDWSINQRSWTLNDGSTAPQGTTVYLIDGSTALKTIVAAINGTTGAFNDAQTWVFGSANTDNSRGRISENTITTDKLIQGSDYNFSVLIIDTTVENSPRYMVSATAAQTAYLKGSDEAMGVTFTASLLGANALTYDATSAANGWAAVPEPTSGLLMLLGMAGLALRRRRA